MLALDPPHLLRNEAKVRASVPVVRVEHGRVNPPHQQNDAYQHRIILIIIITIVVVVVVRLVVSE